MQRKCISYKEEFYKFLSSLGLLSFDWFALLHAFITLSLLHTFNFLRLSSLYLSLYTSNTSSFVFILLSYNNNIKKVKTFSMF
jgi:hypothetical protein